MNHTSVLQPGRTLAERIGATVREAMRTASGGLVARWRERLFRRRETRAVDAIDEMNGYMLRDIGAPNWMIVRAAMRSDALRRSLAGLEVRA